MNFPVLKSAAYALIQANDMVLHQGSTQTSERITAPDSGHLKELAKHFRSFEAAVAYPPNQVFIGNMEPRELTELPRPWYKLQAAMGVEESGEVLEVAPRRGRYGEIIPQDEFLALIKAVDVFDLVLLEEKFAAEAAEKLRAHPVFGAWKCLEKLEKNPADEESISQLVNGDAHAEPMYHEGVLVGCVKKAHAFDQALSAHVMFENLVSKASAAVAMGLLLHGNGIDPLSVDYVIECSEEACGDMNQRGGGNFAKAIGEVCGLMNATGSDTRGFCAAPVHALVKAAALVQSGVYKNVIVAAGGAVAKLGMNAKDHVKKGLPILEDVLGAFAAHVGENDGVSPIIRTDIVGRHTIGSGASPQAVTQAIIADPLDRVGLRLADVDAFAVEMQNPEVTESAGAGDVPKANYKMIAALGVMRKEIERTELTGMVERIALPGFAPTQGHIPSGVPLLAYFCEKLRAGEMKRAMVVGKGSLFLGRLTNLFDGVSFVMEGNPAVGGNASAVVGEGAGADGGWAASAVAGADDNASHSIPRIAPVGTSHPPAPSPRHDGAPLPHPDGKSHFLISNSPTRIGLTITRHEHGIIEMLEGAELVDDAGIEMVCIGCTPDGAPPRGISYVPVGGEKPGEAFDPTTDEYERSVHAKMNAMLVLGELDAAVTLHYSFPIGMATVGRAVTPAQGRKAYIAATTGTSDTRRDAALLKNAIGAIAVAKACGNPAPSVGILNIEGANTLARNLRKLRENGYSIALGESARADGGAILRGNDLLQGSANIIVADSLTGNIAMKMLSAFTTGGNYEAVGDGYGPGVGEGMDKIICIISRASGAPVIANAIRYAAQCARGGLVQRVREEYAAARKAGLDDLLLKIGGGVAGGEVLEAAIRGIECEALSSAPTARETSPPTPPPEKVVTAEIAGIEILDLDDAVHALWRAGIYATSGMGCTGPIVLVAPEDEAAAREALVTAGYL